MNQWLDYCANWLTYQYESILGYTLSTSPLRLRRLSSDSLTVEAQGDQAHALAVEDHDIGWILFILPYTSGLLDRQVNQAMGLRSRLLRESNYTSNNEAQDG